MIRRQLTGLGFICSCFLFSSIATLKAQVKDLAYYYSQLPFKMAVVAEPSFPDKTFNIKDYGAVADGKTLNTKAFADAISACTNAGGGKVVVPAGTWLTGPVQMQSNVNLVVEKDALIQFTKDHTQYPIIKQSTTSTTYVPASPIYGYDLQNIAITGAGIIDGAGDSWRPVKKQKVSPDEWNRMVQSGGVVSDDGKIWWPSKEAMDGEMYMKKLKKNGDKPGPDDYLPARDFLRPYMVYFVNCSNLLLEGVTIRNSPKFVFYPNSCTNLTMRSVNIYNDWWAQNGDGIDISACKNVVIYKCTVNAGDDGICMKASTKKGDSGPVLQNVIVAGCTVLRAHGGFVIGSNTDGGMQDVFVDDCNFNGTDAGIRVKSNPGRGGLVKDIYVKNITMQNIKGEAVVFDTYYEDLPAGKTKGDDEGKNDKIPEFRDFYISNIICNGAKIAISLTGLPEMPISKINFENVSITADQGYDNKNTADINFKSVKIITPTGVKEY